MDAYVQALDDAFAAIDVLGAPPTAQVSDADRAYCKAIDDLLSEIDYLRGARLAALVEKEAA